MKAWTALSKPPIPEPAYCTLDNLVRNIVVLRAQQSNKFDFHVVKKKLIHVKVVPNQNITKGKLKTKPKLTTAATSCRTEVMVHSPFS